MPSTVSQPSPSRVLTRLRPRLQELQTIAQAGASGSEVVVPAGLAQPKGVGEFRRKPREGPQRRMVDHRLPPYVECNFRSLHFMMVRFPKVSDFPREKCASLPSGPPPRGRGPTCPSPALTSLPAFSRALPLRACAIGCPPAAVQSASSSAGQSRSAVAPPDATRPRPLAQGLPTGESRLALPPLLQGVPTWLSGSAISGRDDDVFTVYNSTWNAAHDS